MAPALQLQHKVVFLSNKGVHEPLHVFDAYDNRHLMENCGRVLSASCFFTLYPLKSHVCP
jgi:hypothetical protein